MQDVAPTAEERAQEEQARLAQEEQARAAEEQARADAARATVANPGFAAEALAAASAALAHIKKAKYAVDGDVLCEVQGITVRVLLMDGEQVNLRAGADATGAPLAQATVPLAWLR